MALGFGEMAQPIKHRSAELVQAGERKLYLGLDADGAHDAALRRLRREVLQQRGLANSSLAAQDEGPAPARQDARDDVAEDIALAASAPQSWAGVAARCRHFAR